MGELIRNTILKNYKTINNFIDTHYTDLNMSRTHIYQLVNYNIKNPGVQTLEKLAVLLKLPKEDVINDYLTGYRNSRTEDK